MTADVTQMRANATALRARVDAILARTGLVELFSQTFGTCAPTGSFAYDLMVWPDIDIHMPVAPDRRVEWVRFIAEINDRFEAADRDLILHLKTAAREKPDYYGAKVFSMDIYRFVLAGAGTTLDALDAWKAKA